MKSRSLLLLALLSLLVFSACDDDDMGPMIDVPETYEFTRDGATTISFSGQTDRILMGEELISAMKDFSISVEALQNMYVNPEGIDPFANADLNASSKSVRGKTAASADYFSANTAGSAAIKAAFDAWIAAQVNEIAPAENDLATAGTAGQIADGSSVIVRYGQNQ